MKIERHAAASLAAVIENDLRAIERIEDQLEPLARGAISDRDAATVAYGLHNIYSAFENSFDQISRTFENHVVDASRWHRELLAKMFLEIQGIRPAVLRDENRVLLHELLRFRHLFRHSYDFQLDARKLEALLRHWQQGREQVLASLRGCKEKLEGVASTAEA